MSATADHPRAGSPGPDDGDESLFEDLVEELTDQLQAGDAVDVESFLARHPAQAERLRRLIPSLELMDDLGQWSIRDGNRAGPPPTDPAAGRGELGDFRLIREVGRGGMGIVYEAEQVSLGRRVALKLLPMAAAMDPRQIQRFRVEAQAAACLHHPHIVPVHGVGCERGVHYYAMQLIDGRSLAAMIADLRRLDGLDPADGPAADLAAIATSDLAARLLTGGAAGSPGRAGSDSPTVALPTDDPVSANPTPEAPPAGRTASSGSSTRNRQYVRNIARLALEAAEALDHAHTRGILHRDIKPANLLIDAEGRLWVTDFGLAQVRGDDRLTLTGDLLGTLRYMSPEQALGRRVVIDGRTDVYSLGVTLYELLTLHPAVDGHDRAEILRRIADGEPPPLRKVNAAVPADLETIVLKATAKEPTSRYATAQELADDLRNYLEDRPIRARRPSLAERARRWGRRHRTLAWSAATTTLVAALMLAGGIGYLTRDRAARLAQTGQRVAEALAEARTAIEAGDLTLAGQRVAEAEGRLGPERERLPSVAAATDRIRHEIEARQADAARFSRLLKGASDAQDRMGYGYNLGGERIAEETLGLYGILTEKDWLSRMESSYLTADQKQQVRETAYVLLVSLADFGVRWNRALGNDPNAVARSLDLLQRAQAFHQPTRAFYFVRRVCRERQGDTAAAADDDKRFKAAPARTAWDYFLPGHSAGWGGDLDEAIRSYQAALTLQPNHYNSLYFLASRLAEDKINRRPEAIAYATGCIALRPDHEWAYITRGDCRVKLGQVDAAKADFEAALAASKTDPNRGGSLKKLAEVMLEKSPDRDAQEFFAEVMEIARRVRWDETDSAALYSTSIVAALYAARREFSKAEPLWVKALEVCRRRRGEEHEDTLAVKGRLAQTYKDQGKLAQAEPLFVNVLEVLRRALGGEHRDTLQAMNNLACTCFDQGKFAEAEPLLVQALGVSRRVFGGEDRDTLTYLQNLARMYPKQGMLAQAEPLLVEALDVGRRVLGEQDPYTIGAMDDLASLYMDRREYSKAESLWIKMLEVSRRVSREEHPDTIKAMHNLAMLYSDQGDNARAEPLLVKALEIGRRVLGDAHPDIRLTAILLAHVYWSNRKVERSIALVEDVLKATRDKPGADRPETPNAMVSLGYSFLAAGRLREATDLFEQLWSRARIQPDWPVARFAGALGEAYEQAGQFAKAEALYREALEAVRQGRKAAADATYMQVVLARNLLKQQRYAEAEPLLRDGLKSREQTEPDDWGTFHTRSLLGGSLLGRKKYAEAEPLLLAGYEGMNRRAEKIPLPVRRPRLSEAIERLVQLYEAWGQPENAAAWRAKLPPAAAKLPDDVFTRP